MPVFDSNIIKYVLFTDQQQAVINTTVTDSNSTVNTDATNVTELTTGNNTNEACGGGMKYNTHFYLLVSRLL